MLILPKQNQKPIKLSLSCVTYASDPVVLAGTLLSLSHSCEQARAQGLLEDVQLYLIDNGPTDTNLQLLYQLKKTLIEFDQVHIATGHGNVGYGCGHNLAINRVSSDYHLIINPDVIVDKHNITIAIDYMQNNTQVGLVAPDAVDEFGERQYLAKRNPSFLVLLTRAFSLGFMRKLMAQKLYCYEYRDIIPAQAPVEIELASGCYMFLRTSTAQQIGGFDPDFFMYFEDFDLSRRISKISNVVHSPELKITHYGGGAAKKGFLHLRYFFVSYLKFITKHICDMTLIK